MSAALESTDRVHILASGAVTGSADGITLRVVSPEGAVLLIRMTDDQAARVQTALGTVLGRRQGGKS